MDLAAHGLNRWRPHYVITHPELYYQRVLRRVEYTLSMGRKGRLPWLLARLRLASVSLRTGISIPPLVFGPGLSIAHYGSIVVNDRARVGAWCRIHSATNIGVYDGGVPEIGDFAYIGPGAVVFGDVRIGNGVTIGANSVARSDVPDDHSVIGHEVVARSLTAKVMPRWILAQRASPDL